MLGDGIIPGPTSLSCALGESVIVWNDALPEAGGDHAASRAVSLAPLQAPTGFAVSGRFASDPGMFQIDVQVAAVDEDDAYQICENGNRTSSNAKNFSFYFHSTDAAPFVRLFLANRSNHVPVTATLSRF